MVTEKFMFAGSDGTLLPALIYLPDESPKLIVQITHGMTEHIARYERLARSLTALGAAVAGFDLRGHGECGGDARIASLGEGGWEHTLKDMNLFYEELDRRFADLPHFMLGFSLGSFLLREYLESHPAQTAGVILLGTGYQPPFVLKMLRLLVKGQIKQCGIDGTTPLVQNLSFETYNRSFAPNRTAMDWLCSDETSLDVYLADPLCRSAISAGLFYDLLGGMLHTGRANACASWRRDMPVLLLSGQNDPVGSFGKGISQVEASMRACGLTNVRIRLFPGARHDLLHEETSGHAHAVRTLIGEWLLENAHHYESLRRTSQEA